MEKALKLPVSFNGGWFVWKPNKNGYTVRLNPDLSLVEIGLPNGEKLEGDMRSSMLQWRNFLPEIDHEIIPEIRNACNWYNQSKPEDSEVSHYGAYTFSINGKNYSIRLYRDGWLKVIVPRQVMISERSSYMNKLPQVMYMMEGKVNNVIIEHLAYIIKVTGNRPTEQYKTTQQLPLPILFSPKQYNIDDVTINIDYDIESEVIFLDVNSYEINTHLLTYQYNQELINYENAELVDAIKSKINFHNSRFGKH